MHTHIYLSLQYCLDETISLNKGAQDCFLYIVNWPFNKLKILYQAKIFFEKTFWLIYCNTHLKIGETLPLTSHYIQRIQESANEMLHPI